MNENKAKVESAPKFNTVEWKFDDETKVFKTNLLKVAELLSPGNPDAIDPVILFKTVEIMLKDLVHRSSWARGIDSTGKDETDRLLAIMTGTAQAGRFKVTDKDRDKATQIMKEFKHAPDQTKIKYLKNNGLEYVDDFDQLCVRYMNRRAAVAEAERNNL
jgi:hypothetical protein